MVGVNIIQPLFIMTMFFCISTSSVLQHFLEVETKWQIMS